jgi:ABC-type glycerol-3-phosphate transport system permease component
MMPLMYADEACPMHRLSLAGILTVIIFTFTLVMQEFVYGLTFVTSASQKTVSVGVPIDLVWGDVYYWGPLMAGCLIASDHHLSAPGYTSSGENP